MNHSQQSWKRRLAPSLCVLLASTGSSARADDALLLPVPGQLVVTGASAPITPVGHADEDDPPPPPPFELPPTTGVTARRGSPANDVAPLELSPAENEGFSEVEVAPEESAVNSPESAAPNALPGDFHLDAQGLAAPPAAVVEDIPDVNISAPIP